jgi:tRNA-dihydrouridine synthase A
MQRSENQRKDLLRAILARDAVRMALLAQVDRRLFGQDLALETLAPTQRDTVIETMTAYLQQQVAAGVPVRAVVRHMFGLFQSERGARAWRRQLSDPLFLAAHGVQALRVAARAVQWPAAA